MPRSTESSYGEEEQSWQWSHGPGETEPEVQGLSGRKNSSKSINSGLGSEGKPASPG